MEIRMFSTTDLSKKKLGKFDPYQSKPNPSA